MGISKYRKADFTSTEEYEDIEAQELRIEEWEVDQDERREAAVIRIEVLKARDAWLVMGAILILVAVGLGSDIAGAEDEWKSTRAPPPDVRSDGSHYYSVNATPTVVNYIGVGRLLVSYNPPDKPKPFGLRLVAVFHNQDNTVLYSATQNAFITCTGFNKRCEDVEVPSFPYVFLPEHGPLYARLTLFDVNTTAFDPEYTTVALQIHEPDGFGIIVIVRYVCIVMLLTHAYYYKKALSLSVDPLRPEHYVWGCGLLMCILYCNPFFPLALLHRSGNASDEFVAFLVLQVPQFFSHFVFGMFWGIIAGMSKGAGDEAAAAMYSRILSLTTLLTVLQITYIIASGTCFAVIGANFLGGVTLVHFVGLMFMGVTLLAVTRITTGLCCCCGSCVVKQQLRHHPYYPSRDRQLLLRLLIFYIFIAVVVVLFALLPIGSRTSTPYVSLGDIIPAVISMHFMAFCGTPVFLKGQTDKPPSPMTDEWKTTKWQPEWFNWIVETPGTRCLYVFMTSQEEEAFWAMQDPPQDWRWRMFIPFNYEACAWSLFFARNSYRLDFLSPTVSAVVAAIAIVRSTSDTSYKKAGPRKADSQLLMSVSTKRFDVVRVVHMAGMQVILGVHDEHFVVAFRGSSNLQNWKDDLTFPRVPWDEMMKETGFQRGEENGYCFTSVPLVHSGFLSVWKAVDQTIVSVIERYSEGRPLVVTGHSLGAALATLASFSLSLRYPERRMAVWTYGSPLVGNKAFARVYRSVVKYCFRVVNENDLITRAVFTLGNSHVGTLVTLAAANGMLTVDPPFFERLVSPTRFLCSSAIAHSIAQYRTALYQSFLISSSDPSQFRCLPE